MASRHTQRYGGRHQRLRKSWTAKVAAGLVDCARCGERIEVGEPWDLGHVDGGGPADYSGPEHARCNRRQAGRVGNAVRRALARREPVGELVARERGYFEDENGALWKERENGVWSPSSRIW